MNVIKSHSLADISITYIDGQLPSLMDKGNDRAIEISAENFEFLGMMGW